MTFITSIFEHDDSDDLHGRLSMWRALGMSTARVAIVFKVSRFFQDQSWRQAMRPEHEESCRIPDSYCRHYGILWRH
jgi:hypothetical protein